MRQLQRFFRSPNTVCVAAEGHLLAAEEPGSIRPEWKPWRFDALPIVLATIPVSSGTNRSGQSHEPKIAAIRQALHGVERVIIATDPGREGSMIAWEVLEHLGWQGRVDRLKLGALDDVSIRRAFAALAKEPASGERDYAAYLEALCRQYEDYHLGLNGTRAISLRLRPPAFREPWRFGGVQTPTLAILADLEERIRAFVPQDFFKVALHLGTRIRCGADPVACAQGADPRRGRGRDDPGGRSGVVGSPGGRAEGCAAGAAPSVLEGHPGPALRQAVRLGPAAHGRPRPGPLRSGLPQLPAHRVRGTCRRGRLPTPRR